MYLILFFLFILLAITQFLAEAQSMLHKVLISEQYLILALLTDFMKSNKTDD